MQKETWNEIANLKIVNLKILPNFFCKLWFPTVHHRPTSVHRVQFRRRGKNRRKRVRTAGSSVGATVVNIVLALLPLPSRIKN